MKVDQTADGKYERPQLHLCHKRHDQIIHLALTLAQAKNRLSVTAYSLGCRQLLLDRYQKIRFDIMPVLAVI